MNNFKNTLMVMVPLLLELNSKPFKFEFDLIEYKRRYFSRLVGFIAKPFSVLIIEPKIIIVNFKAIYLSIYINFV